MDLRTAHQRADRFETRAATRDPSWVKWALIGLGVSYFALFLLLPLISVFVEALRKGMEVYFAAIVEPDAIASIKAHIARRCDRRTVERDLRCRRSMGRVPSLTSAANSC